MVLREFDKIKQLQILRHLQRRQKVRNSNESLIRMNLLTFWCKCQTLKSNGTIKGALSGLRSFFGTKSPLKMMKNVNFKFYDVTAWLTSNCNTHIAQYLKK